MQILRNVFPFNKPSSIATIVLSSTTIGLVSLSSLPAKAASLVAGDIAIVSFNFDNPDALSFVALTDIDAGTEIHFTDKGWLASGQFRSGEGSFTWTAAANVLAGTVVSPVVSGVAFAATGDQILAYQGLASNPTFLYGLNSDGSVGEWQTDATSANTSALPSGLVNGTTAIALPEIDNTIYNGTTTGTKAELLAAIGDASNWLGSNSTRQTLPTANFTVLSDDPGDDPVSDVPEPSSLLALGTMAFWGLRRWHQRDRVFSANRPFA